MIARFRLLLLVPCAIALAACGSSDSRTATTSSSDTRSTTTAATRTTAEDPAASTGEASDAGDDGEAVTPTPAAQAVGRRLDALVTAYAPASDRINFLVTAETLRADAVAADAPDDVVLERAGVVRVEARRMLGVLNATRVKVAAVKVSDVDQQQVRDLMLLTITTRTTAVKELQVAMEALGNEAIGDTERERLVDQWHASWNESLRTAREATTTMQDARARLGLEPAPEESIR